MEVEGSIGENIIYGGETPLEDVLTLAMGDGDLSREHRDSIF